MLLLMLAMDGCMLSVDCKGEAPTTVPYLPVLVFRSDQIFITAA